MARTQVGIVGAGPAGLVLALLLDREGLVHHGIQLRRDGETRRIALSELTGRVVTIYGQQEVVKDLIEARRERGGELHFEVDDVAVERTDGPAARLRYRRGDRRH